MFFPVYVGSLSPFVRIVCLSCALLCVGCAQVLRSVSKSYLASLESVFSTPLSIGKLLSQSANEALSAASFYLSTDISRRTSVERNTAGDKGGGGGGGGGWSSSGVTSSRPKPSLVGVLSASFGRRPRSMPLGSVPVSFF